MLMRRLQTFANLEESPSEHISMLLIIRLRSSPDQLVMSDFTCFFSDIKLVLEWNFLAVDLGNVISLNLLNFRLHFLLFSLY